MKIKSIFFVWFGIIISCLAILLFSRFFNINFGLLNNELIGAQDQKVKPEYKGIYKVLLTNLSGLKKERKAIKKKYDAKLKTLNLFAPYKEKKYYRQIFLDEYKQDSYYKKYEKFLQEVEKQRKILQKRYLKEKDEQIISQASELFVFSFNILFEFWEDTSYDFYYGATKYPQFGSTGCGVLVSRFFDALGMQYEHKTTSRTFPNKKVNIWQAWPDEEICTYNKAFETYDDKCYISFKHDVKSSGCKRLFYSLKKIKPKKGISRIFIIGLPWHIFFVAENYFDNKELYVYHALNQTEKHKVADNTFANNDDLYVHQLGENFFKKWILQ